MAAALSALELLHAVLALKLGLLSLDDAQAAIDACAAGQATKIRDALHDAQRLSQAQSDLIERIVETYLALHDGDAERSLASVVNSPDHGDFVRRLDPKKRDATVSYDGSKTSPRQGVLRPPADVHATSAGERFRKLRLHAAGGIGEVSLARDEQVRRDVALKELQARYADDLNKRQRFVLEGEVTGALEHPGIVPVYAMGVDAVGRPFYAMRFVRGQSLRNAVLEWHENLLDRGRYGRNSLELRRLLGRFISVCQAIEYAHSRGVIHRDIKPANIMLGKYGETYVVDWGMARVMTSPSADPAQDAEEIIRSGDLSGSSDTQFGSIMGTPAYMSPEQAAGLNEDVAAASDIYSLGATLYFLLTGRAPFEADDQDAISIIKKVAQNDYPPPRQVCPAVPRELDAICCRAMGAAPADRYATATALADDIEHWLADEPVAACPPRTAERVARWARKHRNWVTAGAASLAFVAVAATVAAMAIDRARQREQRLAAQNLLLAESESAARDEAERRFLQARQTVDTWLTGYSEAIQHFPGMQPVRARMLELAAKEYEAFVAEKSDEPAVRLERGRTQIRLGSIYRLLGNHDQSLAALRDARETLEALAANQPDNADAVVSLGLALATTGLVEADGGDVQQAGEVFDAGVKRLQAALQQHAEHPELLSALVTLWTNRGGVLATAGKLPDAEAAFAAARAHGETLTRLAPDVLRHRAALATANLGAGQVKLALGDAAEASRRFEEAASFFTAAAQLDAANANYLQLLSTANLHLASARRRLGDLPGEEAAYRVAIDASTKLVDAQPDVPAYAENLAIGQLDLGQLFLEEFAADKAEPILHSAVERLARLAALYPSVARYREAWAAALDNLAQAQLALGRHEPALASADQAAAQLTALVAAWPNVAPYRERLAAVECTAGMALFDADDKPASKKRFAAGVKLFDEALRDGGPASRRLVAASALDRFGQSQWADDPAAAAKLFQRARAQWDALLAESHDPQFVSAAAWSLATCPDADQRDVPRALALAKAAFEAETNNPRYRLTYGLALALSGRDADCLSVVRDAAVSKFPAAAVFEYPAAIAEHAAKRPENARTAWDAATRWTAANLPGHWELNSLRRVTAEAIDVAPDTP